MSNETGKTTTETAQPAKSVTRTQGKSVLTSETKNNAKNIQANTPKDFPPEIGKYKVLGIIAKGGMGVVYKAFHPSLKRYVVIKKLTARKGSNAERFKREAQILLDLQSPYIVHLFDYFTEGSYRYMVEELVDGMACDALLKKQGSLPPQICMLIMQDACYALKYAHSKDIVHRDIKPGNILISKHGEIKLADFGIASDESEKESDITQSGVALGTPAYMPPEQFEDSAKVDQRADIYALGIMLYELVTGSKPYPGTFSLETLQTIRKGRYIDPRKIDKTIPKEICRLIRKMIKPKAKHRFQDIEQVLKKVKKYLKHYDTHELRVQTAKSVISPNQYTFSPQSLLPKDRKKRIVKRIFAWTSAVLLAGFLFIYSNLCYRTVLSHWYKPVYVEMAMPVSLLGQMDLPVKAFFFENDGKDMPEVSGSHRTFKVKGSRLIEKIMMIPQTEVTRSSGRNTTYNMKPVYLKKGDYRIKVVVGPYIRWESFSVGDEQVLLKVDYLKNMRRQMKIHPQAFDSETGNNLTGDSTFEIYYKNKWTSLDNIPLEEIQSATVWKFSVSCPGYNSEVFSLLIDWYQDELFLTAGLKSSDK